LPLARFAKLLRLILRYRSRQTGLTRPLTWSDISSRFMDPDNTSADFNILRNSPKFFSWFELSG
jgi:hypothetical protein